MIQVWLKPNRRALALGMILPGVVAALGAWLALAGPGPNVWVQAIGWAICAAGLSLVVGLAAQAARPRIGYRSGELLLQLNSGRPIAVPIDVIEGFLMGQGPTQLPGERSKNWETVTVVVRLAEKAEAWHRHEVNPALAKWCDGYITIRGTWCEPLDIELVNRLNRQLGAAQREVTAQGGVAR